jgi:hypothetical protein
MRPYSQNLRERILAKVARGEGSLREIAEDGKGGREPFCT